METNQRHNSFCARPGCGIAWLLHGRSAVACSNFIQPGSKEANEMKRDLLRLVTPLPETEEETVEIDPPSDAELLEDWVRTGEML